MKNTALPEVTIAAAAPIIIMKNKNGFSLRSFLFGFGMVSYLILLTIIKERISTRGITISENGEVKPSGIE